MLSLLEAMWGAGFADACVGSVLALVSSSQSWNPSCAGEVSSPRLPIAYGFDGPSSRVMAEDVDQLAVGVGDGCSHLFVPLATFHGINISTMATFKVIRWRLACKAPENLTINSHCVHHRHRPPPRYRPRPPFPLPLPPLSPPLMKLDSHKRV